MGVPSMVVINVANIALLAMIGGQLEVETYQPNTGDTTGRSEQVYYN
jgi:hypothetical protein